LFFGFWNCFGVSDVLIWGFLYDNGFCYELVERFVERLESREMGISEYPLPWQIIVEG
jgi:hypothetical protein